MANELLHPDGERGHPGSEVLAHRVAVIGVIEDVAQPIDDAGALGGIA